MIHKNVIGDDPGSSGGEQLLADENAVIDETVTSRRSHGDSILYIVASMVLELGIEGVH